MRTATSLRFERSQLSSLCGDSLSDAFAEFVAEVLTPSYAGLHLFPDGGKDDAIDFSANLPDGRMVGECKVVGDGTFADVQRRWREVITRLRRHLSSPDGPLTGQSQYAPWYSAEPAIRQYVFCTSGVVKNQKRLDQLKKEIRDDLRGLGRTYPHLAHLTRVRVIVLDWRKLVDSASPHTLFRWFTAVRPRGLVPIDVSTQADSGTFREYLQSGRMPYYSLSAHRGRSAGPGPGDVLDEGQLVDALCEDDTLGLMIAGAGGLGKTRLTIEIGRRAAEQGWAVLRVHPPLALDAIDDFVAATDQDQRVLLLFDYVETQPRFSRHRGSLIQL